MKEAGGIRPDYLDNYVANIWIPTRVDLNDLTRRLRPYRRKWNSDYIKIRDQVFAHTIAADLEDVAALFSRTVITDIEDIFQGLHDILDIVWELWTNGRHPNRHKPSMRSIEDVVEDTRQLLRKL